MPISKPVADKNLLQKDIFSEIIPELLALFRSKNIHISRDQTERIARKVEQIQNYQPRVAVFGKTGSGKSSLCNSIFGQDVAPVSDTDACTREPQEYLLRLSGTKSIILIDVPGIGESETRDEEYSELYTSLLPHIDLLLWVVKSDDRALSIDEQVWNTSAQAFMAAGCPVFIVLNQVDKLNPIREWDTRSNIPGPNQQQLITAKIASLSAGFQLSAEQIIPVSAMERYNIASLVESIVFALPNEKKLTFLNAVLDEVVSDIARREANRGFWASINSFIKQAFEGMTPYIPAIAEVIMIVLGKRRT